jgi:hypothetical protein
LILCMFVLVAVVLGTVALGLTFTRTSDDNDAQNPSPLNMHVRNDLTVQHDSRFSGSVKNGIIKQLSSKEPIGQGRMVVVAADGISLTTAPSVLTSSNVPDPKFWVSNRGKDADGNGTDKTSPCRTISFAINILNRYGHEAHLPNWSGTAYIILLPDGGSEESRTYTFPDEFAVISSDLGGRTVIIMSLENMVVLNTVNTESSSIDDTTKLTTVITDSTVLITPGVPFVQGNGIPTPIANLSGEGFLIADTSKDLNDNESLRLLEPGFELRLPTSVLNVHPGFGDTIIFQNMRIVPTSTDCIVNIGEDIERGHVEFTSVQWVGQGSDNYQSALNIVSSFNAFWSHFFISHGSLVVRSSRSVTSFHHSVLCGAPDSTSIVSNMGPSSLSIENSIVGYMGYPYPVEVLSAGGSLRGHRSHFYQTGDSPAVNAYAGTEISLSECDIRASVHALGGQGARIHSSRCLFDAQHAAVARAGTSLFISSMVEGSKISSDAFIAASNGVTASLLQIPNTLLLDKHVQWNSTTSAEFVTNSSAGDTNILLDAPTMSSVSYSVH